MWPDNPETRTPPTSRSGRLSFEQKRPRPSGTSPRQPDLTRHRFSGVRLHVGTLLIMVGRTFVRRRRAALPGPALTEYEASTDSR